MVQIKRKIIEIIIIILILGLVLYIFYPRKIRIIIGENSHNNPYNRCFITITRSQSDQQQNIDRIEINNPEKTTQIYDFIANYRVRKTLDIIDSGHKGEGDFIWITFYSNGTGVNSIKSVAIFNNNYISIHSKTDNPEMYRFVYKKMDLKQLESLFK